MKNLILGAFLIISSLVRVNAQKSEVFAPDGKAINGYDVVAFFKESKPVMGSDNNLKVKDSWMKDQQALIEKADKNWPDLKDKQ